VIGCRKKVVVYGAGTQLGAAWELALAHSPRAILFPAPVYADRPHAVHLLYSPQASAILSIRDGPANVPSSGAGATTPGGSAVLARLSVVDAPSMGYPPTRAPAAQAEPAAAFSVAGGWGGFGGMLSRAPVPVGTRTVGGEVLLVRDGAYPLCLSADARSDLGVFLSAEGNFTRSESLHWPTAPDAMSKKNTLCALIANKQPSPIPTSTPRYPEPPPPSKCSSPQRSR
jgi:hypothetical protein